MTQDAAKIEAKGRDLSRRIAGDPSIVSTSIREHPSVIDKAIHINNEKRKADTESRFWDKKRTQMSEALYSTVPKSNGFGSGRSVANDPNWEYVGKGTYRFRGSN